MSFLHVWNFKAIALVISALVILPVFALRGEDLIVRDTTIPTMQGLNCDIPHYVVFSEWDDQVILSGLSTCLHGNAYSTTCLGFYDGGEDYIIALDIQAPIYAYLRLDPKGTRWTGFTIDDSCPPDGDCLGMSTSSGSAPHYIDALYLDKGLYYIMVDTYPTPYCIPEFEVGIFRYLGDPWGVDCDVPISYLLTPNALPLTLGSTTTIGSQNDYTETCLGIYDAGEDLFFAIHMTDSMRLNFTLDPNGVGGSGFAIHDSCPPNMVCLASATSYFGYEYGITGLSLAAGTHYIMVDTWSTATPLTQLYIYIERYFVCGDADGNDVVNISDAVYLINYVFSGGPAPLPLKAGDADESGTVTISDAVYVISHIFAGGPAPCEG